jgi:DeoR family transcriptional regulator of aga operon
MGSPPMIPAARRARVLDLLKRDGVVAIQRLADEIGISISTARRDVDFLTSAGLLERSHGGASLRSGPRTAFEPAAMVTHQIARPAKIAIGRYAASLVSVGQSVILDSSSTVLEAAHALAERDLQLTVVSNDLRIAMVLGPRPNVQMIVPGGQVRPGSYTLLGAPALELVRGLQVDLALIGVHALAQSRPSETSLEAASIKRGFVRAAHRVVLLADSSKFRASAFCEICPIDLVHQVVCDDGLAAVDRDALEKAGVLVTLVPGGRTA